MTHWSVFAHCQKQCSVSSQAFDFGTLIWPSSAV
jgi:hypothetical protein